MNPDWIMAIIALAAIISPIFTNRSNNKYQLKIKQLEMFENSKYIAIERFTKSLETYYFHRTTTSQIEFESSIANLYIYFSFPDYSLFEKLKECINSRDYSKTQFALSEIVRYLSGQLHTK